MVINHYLKVVVFPRKIGKAKHWNAHKLFTKMYELNSLTCQSVNSKLQHVNISDSGRVSCGKTSCSLNSKISWFWLNVEIIALCLHLKLECKWRKIKRRRVHKWKYKKKASCQYKRLRNLRRNGDRISPKQIKAWGLGNLCC